MSDQNPLWHEPKWTKPEVLICDDCRQPYLGPPYYLTNEDDPESFHLDGTECTGSLCVGCADGLWPDDLSDPRAPDHIKATIKADINDDISAEEDDE